MTAFARAGERPLFASLVSVHSVGFKTLCCMTVLQRPLAFAGFDADCRPPQVAGPRLSGEGERSRPVPRFLPGAWTSLSSCSETWA